jgi:hypothetical protein
LLSGTQAADNGTRERTLHVQQDREHRATVGTAVGGERLRAEERLIEALLERTSFTWGPFEVEIRPSGPVRHPLTGARQPGRPVAALWARERLLAVLVGDVLAVSRFGGHRRLGELAAERAESAGTSVVVVGEATLWPLLGNGPRN